MLRLLPPTIGVILLIASGIAHGLITDRWGMGEDIKVSAKKLAKVPATIGDWESQELEIPARQLAAAEAVGSLSRQYVRNSDGSAVRLMILCGRPGPISVHSPTVCFTSSGLHLQDPPKKYQATFGDESPSQGEFWKGNFAAASETNPTVTRTYWGWNSGGEWKVPDNPRLTFARYPHLYKLYLTTDVTVNGLPVDANDKPIKDDVAVEFMRLLLPELDKVLFQTN